ncbi:nuclear export protein Noc3 [Ascosphaera apis ARSEF 7405]|uniref:Nucleolar complex-associated protein 3 n=1 Tax=Ascosphaera apis ARSEF 7405 TaxID=392613 RepID=A0A167ZTC4_9EURO|nr:nuclear export protein Noc3 [Ascosphaera apis ARSEF 7405]
MAGSHSVKRRRLSPEADDNKASMNAFYSNAAEWDLEQDYERRPRKNKKKEKEKTRLPIKTLEGQIEHIQEEQQQPSDDSDNPFDSDEETDQGTTEAETPIESVEEEKPKIPLKEQIILVKEELAHLATLINEDPDEHINQFKRMLELVTSKTHPAIKKLSMVAMAAVYTDVIPGYRIRALSEADKVAKVSKDVRKVRDFEQSLLSGYSNYVKQLTILSKVRTGQEREDAHGLKSVAVTCAAKLLHSVPHFNFRADLLKIVVSQLGRRVTPDFIKAREALEKLFEEDTDGIVSMEAVSLMSKMMKAKEFRIHESALDTFLHLRLLSEFSSKGSQDRVDKEEDQPGKKPKQKKEFRTKKQRKLMKKQKAVEKDLKEADAMVSHEQRDRMQAETLKLVFGIYFRILKQRIPNLMGAVLEGLAKYAHLINQDFFGDLLEALKELVEQADAPTADDAEEGEESDDDDDLTSSRSSSREALLCAITAFALLEGQDASKAASSLHLDLSFFTTHIYRSLYTLSVNPDIEYNPAKSLRLPDPGETHHDSVANQQLLEQQSQRANKVNFQTPTVLLLRCLTSTLIAKGHAAPPPVRVAAFTKRLMTIVLQLPEKSALAVLALLARVSKLHGRKIAPLWNTEERKGDGVFNANAPTVEGSNIFASTIWENELLRLHYCPQVRESAKEVEKIVASVK